MSGLDFLKSRPSATAVGNALTPQPAGKQDLLGNEELQRRMNPGSAASSQTAGVPATVAVAPSGPAVAAPTLDQIAAGTVLDAGMSGAAATQVQTWLNALGFPVTASGTMDAAMVTALTTFQKVYRVQTTGKVGPTTLTKFQSAIKCSITLEQFKKIGTNLTDEKAKSWLPYLNASMEEADISSFDRKTAYLAQIAQESDGFNTMQEYASGNEYEGRTDLGNTSKGDGKKYKGRGVIQVTGKSNYKAAGDYVGEDLVKNPERAADVDVGFRTAAWFWGSHNLNDKADKKDFDGITQTINGGTNGAASRADYFAGAKKTLKPMNMSDATYQPDTAVA